MDTKIPLEQELCIILKSLSILINIALYSLTLKIILLELVVYVLGRGIEPRSFREKSLQLTRCRKGVLSAIRVILLKKALPVFIN